MLITVEISAVRIESKTFLVEMLIIPKVYCKVKRFWYHFVARNVWNTNVCMASSIKTFQIIWNVWNTSENLLKFVIFPDILPINSK